MRVLEEGDSSVLAVAGLQLCSSLWPMFAATRGAVINGLSARRSQFAFLTAPELREMQNVPSIRAASLSAASLQVSCTKPQPPPSSHSETVGVPE